MKNWRCIFLLCAVVVGLVLPTGIVEAEFSDLPTDFVDQLVVGNVPSPTAIAWLPDGTLLATSRAGQVYRKASNDPSTTATSILNLGNAVCSGGETGLLGLAVHPEFASGQPHIYLYYTHHKSSGSCGDAANRANRVSRFTMDGNNLLVNQQVLIDNIPAPGGNHNGGDLRFGRDGMLYVSVGDGGKDLQSGDGQNGNGNARRLSLLNGKILRISPEGAVPADNPFVGTSSTTCATTGRAKQASSGVTAEKKSKKKKRAKKRKKREKRREARRKNRAGAESICGEIFATGLRNPYRIAFDPDDVTGPQRLFINDVGGGAWEEINDAVAGADYGWNLREGPCVVGSTNSCAPDTRFTAPYFAYGRSDGCRVITGGAFVPNGSNWPGDLKSTYLYADMGCDKIFSLNDTNPVDGATQFAAGASASHLAFGSDGALYYADFGENAIRRIVYTG